VQPHIVQVIEEPARELTVVDVLVGAIGVTGVMFLVAVVAGLALGGLLVWMQKKRGRGMETTAQTLELGPSTQERS
jgi:hypothetical protein